MFVQVKISILVLVFVKIFKISCLQKTNQFVTWGSTYAYICSLQGHEQTVYNSIQNFLLLKTNRIYETVHLDSCGFKSQLALYYDLIFFF